MPASAIDVRDDRDGGRFVLEEDGETAELVYGREPGRLLILHTGVPSAVRRRGIGGLLVHATVDRARDEGLTLVPLCPFARDWLVRHQDVVASVAVDWAAGPPTGHPIGPPTGPPTGLPTGQPRSSGPTVPSE